MLSQVRLADRQGLLHGHGLSFAQVAALNYLEGFERAERVRSDKEQHLRHLRYAMVAAFHPASELFPELFEEPEDPMDSTGPVEYDLDQVDLSPEEIERELAKLAAEANEGFTIPGEEVGA